MQSESAATTVGKQPRFYRPELDMIRFCAFFAVFINHSIPPHPKLLRAIGDTGALGMCLFFVLSSFLITELLRMEKHRTGTIRIGAFYVRRVLRIWPLYFSFLALAVVVGHFIPSLHPTTGSIIAMSLLGGNWYAFFYHYPIGFLGPLWSISLEEQFYLVWPSICRFTTKIPFAIIATLLVPLGALTIAYLYHNGADKNQAIWVNSFVQFQFFGEGALLAILLNQRLPSFRALTRIAIAACAIASFLCAQLVFHLVGASTASVYTLIAAYLCAGIGSCLLILSMLGMYVPQWMKPVIYLGKISYGLYVFHLLCIDATNAFMGSAKSLPFQAFKFIFSLACTIGIASLSYRFLEYPFMKMKERFTVIHSRAA